MNPLGPPGKKPGATLVEATGREGYGTAYKTSAPASTAILRNWLAHRTEVRAIETAHELAKWNRDLEGNP